MNKSNFFDNMTICFCRKNIVNLRQNYTEKSNAVY